MIDLKALEEQYETAEIKEWGECLIIPLKDFSPEKEREIKSQGYRVRYQGWSGQTCAFIILGNNGNGNSQDPQTSQAENEPMSKRPEIKIPKPTQQSVLRAELERQHWTFEEMTTLKKLYESHMTVPEIAKQLHRPFSSVQGHIKRLQLRRLPQTEATPSTAEIPKEETKENEERKSAEPDREVQQNPVSTPRCKPWTLEDIDTLKRLYSANVTAKQIAEKLGRTEESVNAYIAYRRLSRSPRRPEFSSTNANGTEMIQEFLQASHNLFPTHRRAAAVLLKEAVKLLED